MQIWAGNEIDMEINDTADISSLFAFVPPLFIIVDAEKSESKKFLSRDFGNLNSDACILNQISFICICLIVSPSFVTANRLRIALKALRLKTTHRATQTLH